MSNISATMQLNSSISSEEAFVDKRKHIVNLDVCTVNCIGVLKLDQAFERLLEDRVISLVFGP